MTEVNTNGPRALADYLAIVRRRKWILALTLVAVMSSAVMVSALQRPVYQATAQVLINRANIVSSITNVTDPSTIGSDPTRFLTTQSKVARSMSLASRAVKAAGVPGMTPGGLLASSSVSAATNADVLNISVSSPRPRDAVRLANAYAQEYTKFKTDLDTARINDAVEALKARIESLSEHGVSSLSPSYATLLQYEGQLETVGKLLANNTQVLQRANSAPKIRPRTKRNAVLAFLLGGILAIGLSFLAEALDRRVRSEKEIEETLRVPLLARAPRPPRGLEVTNRLVMLAEPTSLDAEPFRRLRANFEFLNLERHARTILITSAIEREGKSTTIANLAVALARSGRRVALVDLDLRRSHLHKFFQARSTPGISDVALNHAKLLDALRPVPLTGVVANAAAARGSMNPEISANGRPGVEGVLNLLPAGTAVSDPGEFVGQEGIALALSELADRFDYVLVDGPPLLAFGDTITLSARVDAILVVSRLLHVSRHLIHDFARQLETCQAKRLGFVLASAELEEGYDRGDYYYRYTPTEAEERVEQRGL
jgi:tyrosine-protein kinase